MEWLKRRNATPLAVDVGANSLLPQIFRLRPRQRLRRSPALLRLEPRRDHANYADFARGFRPAAAVLVLALSRAVTRILCHVYWFFCRMSGNLFLLDLQCNLLSAGCRRLRNRACT